MQMYKRNLSAIGSVIYRITGFIRTIVAALLFTIIYLSATTSGNLQPDPGINRTAFSNPPVETHPLVRWWWPGGDVNETELAREVDEIFQAGFGGMEIQSFAVGLPADASPEVFTYGTPGWYQHLTSVLTRAKEYGLKIDLTLGSSWPAGGPSIDDAHSLKQLIVSSRELTTGESILALPPPTEPFYYGLGNSLLQLPVTYDPTKMRLVALQAVRISPQPTNPALPVPSLPNLPSLPASVVLEKNSTVDLIPYLAPDGRVHWSVPEGQWLFFAFYEGPTGAKPFYSADPGKGLVLDHLNAASTILQLESLIGTGKQYFGSFFGNTLHALFIDSFELRTELFWTEDFLHEFADRRGYRLEPFLPVLFVPLRDDSYTAKLYSHVQPRFEIEEIGPRVRHDYALTVSELMIERFIDPITVWANKNGLASRIQAHGSPMELIRAYGHANIPETEGLYSNGERNFQKRASSSANIYGRKIISSEVLAFKNNDYATTPDMIIREANKNFAAGVNQLVLHAYPYQYDDKFLFPGWMPFCSIYTPAWSVIGTYGSHLNERDPFWKYMPRINGYISRAQFILQSGDPVAHIALYDGDPDLRNNEPVDIGIGRQLDKNGYAYDYVNHDALGAFGDMHDNALWVGKNSYQALVIENMSSLPWEAAVQIIDFARKGLPVVFVHDIPEKTSGLFAYEERDKFIKSNLEGLFGRSLEHVRMQRQYRSGSLLFISTSEALATALRGEFRLEPDIGLGNSGDVIRFTHRKTGGADYYFLFNEDSLPRDFWVTFPAETRIPEIFDLWTGEVRAAARYGNRNSETRLFVHLEAGAATVVGFEKTGELLHVERTSLASVKREEDGQLTGRAPLPGKYEVWYGNIGNAVVNVGTSLPVVHPIHLSSWDLTVVGTDIHGQSVTRSVSLAKLEDWTSIPELKHFSGTGTYSTTLMLDSPYLTPGIGLELDLGRVYDVSEFRFNGRSVAVRLTEPYRFDVTNYLTTGANKIEIVVTTTLRNRLIGFAATGLDYYRPFAFNPWPASSGLLGLVTLVPYYEVTLDGSTGVGEPAPIPLGLNVVPTNYPKYTEEDLLNAIALARAITGNISFSWEWNDVTVGEIKDHTKMVPMVRAAQQQQLQVTLQLLTFSAFGQPIVPFEPASFGNVEVRKAYLDEVGNLAKAHPDYMVLAPEMNFVQYFNPAEFEQFNSLYNEAYDRIKSISPLTQVGVSYQYDYLRSTGDWSAIDGMGPKQDFIGLTSYFNATLKDSPIYSTQYELAADVPADYYSLIRRKLGPDVSIIFTEIGWSSYYGPGLEEQAAFLKLIPVLLKDVRPENVIYALQHDVTYWTSFLVGLNYIGLIDSTGTPKPSWYEAIRLRNLGVFGLRFLSQFNFR